MSESKINLSVDKLNSLKSKSKIQLSEVSNNNELKRIFKQCDTDKPVDVLETNRELSSWKSSVDNLIKTSQSETDYKIKSGDTITKIVNKLGYTGLDAKKYEQALTIQLKQNGSFMNDKNWLMAGSTIKLLSDAKLKELGIKKAISKIDNNSNSSDDSFTYLVKSGDDLAKIVKSLGYTGENAKKYVQALDAQLTADGSYMNDKKWLMAGAKIKLLSQSKLSELGIKKSSSNGSGSAKNNSSNPTSAKTKQSSPSSKTTSESSSSGNHPVSRRKDTPVEDNSSLDLSITAPKQAQKISIPKNSVELIQSTIKANNHKSIIVNANSLTAEQKNIYSKYKSVYSTEPTVIKDASNNEMHLFFDVSLSKTGKRLGQQSIEIVFKNGSIVTNRYYTNGKIVQDLDQDDKHSAKILNQPVINKPKTKKVIDTPVKITGISISPEVLKGASDEQRQQIREFMGSLMANKAKLMKDLNLDNDAYNNFVKLAIGIAIQESGMENGLSKARKFKNSGLAQAGLDTLRVANIGINKVFGTNNSTATSKGLTQIKIGDWNDDPKIDKMFKKYGIKADGYYNNINANQSAIATIIILNELSKKVKNNQAIKNGIEAAKDRYYITNNVRENGNLIKVPMGYMRVNQGITENDAIMYLYNGRIGALKKGDMTPKDNVYTHNVRRYMSAITVKENPTQRAAALKKARTVTEGQSEKQVKMNNDLGWGIGQISFGTTLYTGGISKNTQEEINNMKLSLLQRGYNSNNVNSLIQKLNKGDIAFANKLTNAEIDAMTEADVVLLLKYSNKLSSQLKNVSSLSQKRKIASSIDREFKKEYLSSHAQQAYMSEVKGKTVKLTTPNKNIITGFHNTGAQARCNKYLTQLRGNHKADGGFWLYDDRINSGKYTGFSVEKDKGINTTNSSKLDILLAKNAADTANTLRTSGSCLTGAKQALIGSGAVSEGEMRNFSNAFELATFLSKHPERFIEITHVQISETVAREITAGDLSSLPAGCVVVFGNKNRSDVVGHAAITSGNGQMYADEVDNSNWDNFVATKANQNGKGEHGYFRVFKLNPAYFDLDTSGKKLVKKQ